MSTMNTARTRLNLSGPAQLQTLVMRDRRSSRADSAARLAPRALGLAVEQRDGRLPAAQDAPAAQEIMALESLTGGQAGGEAQGRRETQEAQG